MFKTFLDGIELVNEPLGIEEFEAQITRNSDRRDIITTFPLSLIFIGDGYQYIKKQQNKIGYCTLIEFRAEILCGGTVTRTLLGTVFITDVIFDLEKCFAEVEVKDDNFAARINNNRSVEVNIGSFNSKSGAFIAGAPRVSLQMFRPSDGTFDDGNVANCPAVIFAHCGVRISYDWKVALTHLIQYITDKAVTGVKSDWYDNLPDGNRYAITWGREMRLGSGIDETPEITFDALYGTLAKLHNLFMAIETDINGNYFVRVEEESYFKNQATLFVLDKIKNVKERFFQDALYSSVRFGDQNASKNFNPDANEIGYILFFNSTTEKFHTDNQCNIDSTLDLGVSDMVYDHNVIKDTIMDDNDTFDEKVFIIQYNHLTSKASNGDPFGDGSRVYNPELLNNKVGERYNLQGSIAKFLGDNDDTFSATFINQSVITHTHPPDIVTNVITPFPFVSEQLDPGNNYDPFTFRYTCPTSGLYSFQVNMNWSIELFLFDIQFPNPVFSSIGQIVLDRFDAGAVLIGSAAKNSNTIVGPATPPNYEEIQFFHTLYLQATDFVTVRFNTLTTSDDHPTLRFKVQPITSIFSCVSTFDGGGVYQEKDPDDYNISIFEFGKYLTGEQIKLMLDNPNRPIEFNRDGENNTRIWPFQHNMKFSSGRSSLIGINSPNDNN